MRMNILLVLAVFVMITVTSMPAMAQMPQGTCFDRIDNDGNGLADRDGVIDANGRYIYPPEPACNSWDANAEGSTVIPEFPMVALPVMAVIGIMFLLHHRKN